MTFAARGGTDRLPDSRFPLGGPREGRFEERDPLDRYGPEREPGGSARANHGAPYVELHAHSAYSFLDGASLPDELAARAAELGYEALALTDHDGVYGSLEFAHAAKHFGVRAITGAEVTVAVASATELQRSGRPGSTEPPRRGGVGSMARSRSGGVGSTQPPDGASAGGAGTGRLAHVTLL